ncbi:MAG TPA: hypothetical protein PLP27_10010 [Crocinitomicaceae bacterium]|nr:hypothetical protein [Crocinitomicaceae bacterium]
MKKFVVFSLTAVLFTAVSCTKFGKNITVKGRVINPITNEPISGITVFMHQSWKSKTIKKMVTGQDGEFELSATHLGYVWAGTDYANYQDYYDLGWDYQNKYYSEIKVEKGKIMNVDYHLVTYGQLHWHIKNINCEGTTDTLWYKIKHQYDNDFLNIWSFPIVGCADIVGNGSDKEKMGNHIIYMKIKRPSGTIYKYDTVFVQKEGVTNFELFY